MRRVATSAGASACWSSMKSARFESSSSPTGESSDSGSWAMRMDLAHPIGRQADLLGQLLDGRLALELLGHLALHRACTWLIDSTMCTGMRIVRAWSAMARVMAWRIHHVAYVENLKPLV